MEKFLRKRDEPAFSPNRLSGYITPEGKIFLSDNFNLKVKRGFAGIQLKNKFME